MGGLLDFLNTDQGRMGLGLLAAAGPRTDGAGFGQRMQEGMGSFDAYKANQLKTQLAEMQIQEHQAAMQDRVRQRDDAQQLRGAATSAFMSPERANAMSMGPMPDGSNMPTVAPGFDDQKYMRNLQALGRPLEAVQYGAATQKDNKPISLAENASLVRPDGTVIFQGQPKAEQKDPKVKQYEYAKAGGYKGSFEQFVTLGPTIMAAAAAPLRDAQVQNIQDENAYNLPAPRKAVSGQVSVTTPDGRSYSFPNQAAASNFKLKAGIR